MRICLLLTNLIRDFDFSMKNNANFFNYDNNDYDVICVLFETEKISEKKKSIKDFFGSKLKLIINIFDNEDDKKKYFKEENILIQEYKQKYGKIKNKLSKYIDNPDFYFPAHNIIQQTLKWNIAHKIRNDYQKKNNISYQCIIRTRCDLCIMDNDYKIIDGPTAEYKKGGIYYHNVNNKSILLNININNINKLFDYYNINLKSNFSFVQMDLISICSEKMADIEMNIVYKLFYAYDNILISNNINNLLKKFSPLSYIKPYIIENKFKFSDFPLKEENEDLKDYLNKCYNEYYKSDNSMVNVFFSKGHTFGQDIEIHSRYLLENNNKHFVIDYFTATKYFKGLELI
tara:strand:+ start:796 stop:1830 length:1035 start_codon:yes stop_codon:yes gene_type:complete